MSGQPNINANDQTKFRQQYLANLNLRVRLDDMNLQANKVYNRTGQLPIEPSDFRSTEEKLADIGRLRIEARSKLSEITDGREANKIAQELNPKQLLFYSQMSEDINNDLKPKYRLGIYAEIFVPYLQNYMNNTANVNGIKDGLQQTSGKDVDLNSKDMVLDLPDANFIRKFNENLLGDLQFYQGNNFEETTMKLADFINGVEAFYLMRKHLPVKNANTENEAYKIVNSIANNIPTKVQINRWYDSVQRAGRSRDMGSVNHQLDKGIELMYIPDEYMEMLLNANKLYPALTPGAAAGGEKSAAPTPGSIRKEERLQDARDRKEHLKSLELGANNIDLFNRAEMRAKAVAAGIPMEGVRNTKAATKEAIELYWLNHPARSGSPGGKGIYGRGLSRPKLRRQDHLNHSDTDWSNGVLATKRFVPFGRYIINRHRLDKDIVAIKRPAGSTIKNLPSEKVSHRLGNIIREIVGGGMPEYEDLENLNDQEKAYLNKIATETNIKDRLSIPAPKKSEIDKETNEYEIMRGEIMSGNDNKDLVKKFKIVLLKLMNKGVIPKGQAKEILVELTSMGF